MTTNRSVRWTLTGVACLCAVTLTAFASNTLYRHAVGQQYKAQRFHIWANPNAREDTFLIDSATGQTWRWVRTEATPGLPGNVWESQFFYGNLPEPLEALTEAEKTRLQKIATPAARQTEAQFIDDMSRERFDFNARKRYEKSIEETYNQQQHRTGPSTQTNKAGAQ